MFLRHRSAALVGCMLLLAPFAARSARGPSTPEERKQALDIIQRWEADPLNPSLTQEREWVLNWIIQIPDVHVTVCVFFDKLPKGDKKDAANIVLAQMFSQAAFVLQNPDRKDNRLAESMAGVEGALTVYEAQLKTNAKDRQPFLDDLIQKRDAGALPQWVKERAVAACHP
jgi:hypothetical protein